MGPASVGRAKSRTTDPRQPARGQLARRGGSRQLGEPLLQRLDAQEQPPVLHEQLIAEPPAQARHGPRNRAFNQAHLHARPRTIPQREAVSFGSLKRCGASRGMPQR